MTFARVLKTDGMMALGEAELALLRDAGAQLVDRPRPTEEELIAHGRDAEAIVTIEEPLTAAVIGSLERCRVIARLGIGVDTVDVGAATAAGIWVTNVPDGSVDEASDHALALLLALTRRVVALDASVRRGEWNTIAVAGPVHRLRGRVLGLVGFGRIARALAPKAAALGLEVWASDPHIEPATIAAAGVRAIGLDRLLADADAVSIHVPLTPETRGLIDRRRLRAMQPGALIVNVSRGGVIDEPALIQALREGHLGGAALDVFAQEPLPTDHPLLALDRVVLTSHAAFYSHESVAEVLHKAVEDVARVLGGERPLRPVNEPRPSLA